MVCAMATLVLTVAYLLVALASAETAQAIAPVYLALVLIIWLAGPHPWNRDA